uniref:Putative secreted protein n=1 Tax=Ixodes ricinus TaxID=34613 RepID=A0A6B0U8K5_IXORI
MQLQMLRIGLRSSLFGGHLSSWTLFALMHSRTSSEVYVGLKSCCRKNPRSGNGPSRKYGMRVRLRMSTYCSGVMLSSDRMRGPRPS